MLEAVKIGGTAMVVGIPTDKYPLDTDLIFKRELRIQGVRIHSQINFKDAVTLASRSEVQEVLSFLATHEFPLSDLDKAVDLAQNSKEVSKIIIKSA